MEIKGNDADFHEKVEMLQMGIISYDPKYSRGDDDIYAPLPKGSFYAHVSWKYNRHISHRSNEITFSNNGEGDLYFYKTSGDIWKYEFRFQYDDGTDEFRNGSVSSEINCNSFMKWFVDYVDQDKEQS